MDDPVSASQEAGDDALAELMQLPLDDALEAIARVQGAMLASMGIIPGTPAFDRAAAAYLALLEEKTDAMGKAMRAGAH